MTVRTEDDLRAALTALERHAPAAARVLPSSERHSSHRLLSPRAIAWLAGITTAAALAGAVTALTLPSGTSGTTQNGGGTSQAAITKTALQAKLLAAFSGAVNEIAREHSTYKINSESPTTIETWSYPVQPNVGQQVRIRTINIAQGGTYHIDSGERYVMPAQQTGSMQVKDEETTVSYTSKVWWRERVSSVDVTQPIGPTLLSNLPTLGKWTAHNTTLNGRAAIEFTMEHTSRTAGSLTDTLWVDASSYLPLRETLNDDSPGMHTIGTSDYEYLPATPANLAQLTPPIPAGFKQVHPALPPETSTSPKGATEAPLP